MVCDGDVNIMRGGSCDDNDGAGHGGRDGGSLNLADKRKVYIGR